MPFWKSGNQEGELEEKTLKLNWRIPFRSTFFNEVVEYKFKGSILFLNQKIFGSPAASWTYFPLFHTMNLTELKFFGDEVEVIRTFDVKHSLSTKGTKITNHPQVEINFWIEAEVPWNTYHPTPLFSKTPKFCYSLDGFIFWKRRRGLY